MDRTWQAIGRSIHLTSDFRRELLAISCAQEGSKKILYYHTFFLTVVSINGTKAAILRNCGRDPALDVVAGRGGTKVKP